MGHWLAISCGWPSTRRPVTNRQDTDRLLVLSPSAYNGKTGLMLCCPMTSQVKGYPFEVLISGERVSAALADQVKSLDWVVRKARHKGKASSVEMAEVRAKIIALIGKP